MSQFEKIVCKSGVLLVLAFLYSGCSKESTLDYVVCNFAGTYKNVIFNERLVGEFSPGIYQEGRYPKELESLQYGRIEIDFRYNGGALLSFAPLMYYGSINKNSTDDGVEEPDFHIAIEIGHYNVIPFPVENLFYTISTFRQPLYCRDTDFPINVGQDYTFVVDKRPEGIILQLKKGNSVVNILPHAFFPDSVQMFFNDITRQIEANKGDSLAKVFMVGKGFAGFEKGIRDFNGTVYKLRLYQYSKLSGPERYEIQKVRNQHTENQQVSFVIKDILAGSQHSIRVKQQFWPYAFNGVELTPNGVMQETELYQFSNNQTQTYVIKNDDLGFYKLYLKTIDNNGAVIAESTQPIEIWVYPKTWDFEFY